MTPASDFVPGDTIIDPITKKRRMISMTIHRLETVEIHFYSNHTPLILSKTTKLTKKETTP